MNKSEPKKHHYVPQFILNRFSAEKKKRLYVFDKTNSKVFLSHVRDVGHENYFYQDNDMGFNVNTETRLSELENICAPVIESIVNHQCLPSIGSDEHRIICLFIAVQLSRTKNMREFLSKINRSMADWVRGFGVDPNTDVENFKVLTETEIKQSSIDVLRSIPGDLVKHILDKEWSLLKSPKGEYFYISDHPVTMHNNYPRKDRGNDGLRLRGIEVYFPLTPRLCLNFMCSEMMNEFRTKVSEHNLRISQGTAFPVDMSEPDNLVNKIDNNLVRVLVPENVEFQNSLQVINSSRFVYSQNQGFELAKDMLKTNPELKQSPELYSSEIWRYE